MSSFYQVADNAISSTATNLSTTGITSVVLMTGDGAKFPQPGNGFRLTLWDSSLYPSNPALDPNMEKVICSGRSGDTVTISATTKTHNSPCTVALLATAEDITDLQNAVNAVVQDKNYTQAFSSASSVTVNHNLGKYPAVTVVDTAGDECRGDVIHNTINQLIVNFSAPFSGTIFCN